MGFLADYNIMPEELDDVVSANPSLRGFILGYMAEYKYLKLKGGESLLGHTKIDLRRL